MKRGSGERGSIPKSGIKPENEEVIIDENGQPHLIKDSRYKTKDGNTGILIESEELLIDNSENIPNKN